MVKASLAAFALTAVVAGGRGGGVAADPPGPSSLTGTWALVAADKELPDGSRVRDYGEAPAGRLMVDDQGRYALQLYKSERVRFASADKSHGTPAEFRDALLGCSAHFGSVAVDTRAGALHFTIEDSSFPNWRGTSQSRSFTLQGDLLTWRVPVRPDGSTPITIWRRTKDAKAAGQAGR